MLWNRSLVMRDVETGSLWSHILGECMQGPLKGKTLEVIPSEMMSWEGWRKLHPQTKVLDLPRTERAYDRNFYRDPSRFVYALVHGGEARAYPLDALAKKRRLQDELAGDPLLVTYDPETTRAAVFVRRAGKRVLHFEAAAAGRLRDRETGSVWDAERGRALSGPLKGRTLKRLPGIFSYRRVWKLFHPDSTEFAGDADTRKEVRDATNGAPGD